MIYAAILAGGIGSRMQREIPKQFLLLGQKEIIVHTIEKFIKCKQIEKIYIAVHKEWKEHIEEVIKKEIGEDKRIHIVIGAQDRNSTIMNVIEDIDKRYGIKEEDVILTHDGVRPFVSQKIIEDNIKSVLKHKACTAAIKAIDTILVSEDSKKITAIPKREQMYQVQTPQSFNIMLLKNTYSLLTEEEKAILTDACKILVIKNIPVHLVEGDIKNIKITTQEDLEIANGILKQEKE